MVLAVLSSTAFTRDLRAQSVPQARPGDGSRAIETGNQALALYQTGRWDEAVTAFREAEALYHSPVFVLYTARALRESGHFLEARDVFRGLLSERLDPSAPEPWKQAQTDGTAEAAALETEIPSVVVRVKGGSPTTRVAVDGREVSAAERLDLDPGAHRAEATDGRLTADRAFTTRTGVRDQEVVLTLPPLPAETPRPSPPGPRPKVGAGPRAEPRPYLPGLLVTGIGVATVLAGGVVGGFALVKKADVRDNLPAGCERTTCPASKRAEVEARAGEARRLGKTADVLWIGGSVVVGLGIGLLLVAPDHGSPVVVGISSRGADVEMTF